VRIGDVRDRDHVLLSLASSLPRAGAWDDTAA
jgi:hypothetical protein